MEEASNGENTGLSMERRHVQLVVSGMKFVTYNTILAQIPEGRLSTLTPATKEYDATLEAYVYDRNSTVFSHIMSAYTSSHLHISHDLCASAVKEELDFWQISADRLSACCQKRYRQSEEDLRTQARVEKSMREDGELESANSGGIRLKIYNLLSHPRSSIPALIWLIVYSVLLFASCIVLTLDTLPEFKQYSVVSAPEGNPVAIEEIDDESVDWNDIVSFIFFFFFIAEWIVRFLTSPVKRAFLMSFINLNDIISTTLMLLLLIVDYVTPFYWVGLRCLFTVCYFLRTLRILKLLSAWRRVHVLVVTIRYSILDLLPWVIVISIATMIFATMVYYMEADSYDSHFRSIPDAFWWAIVTLTTVGYGDMRPIGEWGKLAGSCCAIAGMFLIGLPIPVFIQNYSHAHALFDIREDLLQKACAPNKSQGMVLVKPAVA